MSTRPQHNRERVHTPRSTGKSTRTIDLAQGVLFGIVMIGLALLGNLLNSAFADSWAMLQRILTRG